MAQRRNKALSIQIRKDQETAKAVTVALMSRVDGRRWVWLRLADAMIFQADSSLDPGQLAWRAGMRNAGLKLLAEVMEYSGTEFVVMFQENSRTPTPQPEEDLDVYEE